MADLVLTWGEFAAGAVPLKLVDNGDETYSLGMVALGSGVGSIIDAPWKDVVDGKYPLKFVDNGDSSYSFATDNG